MEGSPTWVNSASMGTLKCNLQGTTVSLKIIDIQGDTPVMLITTRQMLILWKLFPNIEPTWVGLVLSGIWRKSTSWYLIGDPFLSRVCWSKLRFPKLQDPKHRGCSGPHTCKYCSSISHSGVVKVMHNNKTYNIMMNGRCQSNNIIYCLKCNWCNIKYVGQKGRESFTDSKVIFLT